MTAHAQTRQRRRRKGISGSLPRCSKCDSPNDRAPQRYCARCHAAYQKNWRQEMVMVPRETVCFILEDA